MFFLKNLAYMAIFSLIMGSILTPLSARSADWPADVPDKLTINEKVYENDHKKGPVEFPHKKHFVENGLDCVTCHHVYENGKNVWKQGDKVKGCGECHPYDKNDGKKIKMKMGTVFHNLCRKCHQQGKKGPTKCDGCHQKK